MRLIACVLGHSLIGLLGVVLNFMPVSVLANANATPILPKGLSTNDWQSIQAAWQAGRHAVAESTDQPGTWTARNPGQQWLLHFDGRGFEAQPDGTDWRWGLQLQRWGMAGAEQVINGKAVMLREGQRARYQWSSELEEWYVNDARGLEHGYTVHTQPAGTSNRLRFEWAVRGSLQPQIGAGGGDVRFVDAGGVTNLTYAGLNVWDADGQPLPAVFESMAEGLALSVDTRNARYPITIDPIAQQAYLKASNTGVVDSFGWSVAISGDTVVVGAQAEDSNSTTINGDQSNNAAGEAGAAYVFVRTAGIWSQQAYLKASNTDADDRFGISVAISGDTIVVGATYEDSNSVVINAGQGNNAAADAGAAYVFVRSGSIWSQQAYLKASNTDAVDRFGGSVAIFNNTVVVGAVNESSNSTTINGGQSNNAANYAGAAYVFERSGSSWSQQAYLKASNTDINDFFGLSVAVAGNTIAVGTAYEDSNSTVINGDQSNNSATNAGAVYVFERSGT
ncbi:MAG TPA: FG-GAP repeat protein, partial [Pseudomonadota bacterium]|nr:FG-GAP repeat protein [Pseudomonadota bacterium]